jgi:hypothetical protein
VRVLRPRSKLNIRTASAAIELYNKYRSPEVTARLISIDAAGMTLQFEGTFCNTCGFMDYFEDLIFEVKRLASINIRIEYVEEKAFQTFIVRYLAK